MIPSGFGQPVDEIDRACQTLSKGYTCIKQEHPECDIHGTARADIFDNLYEPINVRETTSDDFIISRCMSKNSDECIQKICIIETTFAQDMKSLGLETCEHQCCGAYPNRMPYMTIDETGATVKECCNGEWIFNPLTHCCGSDGIKGAGTC